MLPPGLTVTGQGSLYAHTREPVFWRGRGRDIAGSLLLFYHGKRRHRQMLMMVDEERVLSRASPFCQTRRFSAYRFRRRQRETKFLARCLRR